MGTAKTTSMKIEFPQWQELRSKALQYNTTVSAILRLAISLGLPLIDNHYRALARRRLDTAGPTVKESLERMKRGENPLPPPATNDTFDEIGPDSPGLL